ncbi:methylated-DNA--[protein]-cysteine S-methyltransferase [Nocardia yamanashiensis]|uniref:methylated-DNA--[protein]-cysteine S-methyltransferase n=1 Tax=Nocardia yamanashiensis TaxID=209247 RepID=UPI001E620A22|nr:methylated-DNA--[protein]-cysteine S-methyltransferase [Nocardia yamanashiensis]UGT44743.1 methylated-DNA--[protein]-cysteine S-methyltransferase [Nocardia yamanashiensis]
MTVYATIDSPLGELLLAGTPSGGGVVLTTVSMNGAKAAVIRPDWIADRAAFTTVIEQLEAYFAGERTGFDLEMSSSGSEFQDQVWRALDEIPYGTTVTYGEIAARIGAPRAAIRAVGAAIGANPLLIVRPCHRVIGANGSLTGYAGGLPRKQQLLTLEHVLLAA